MTLRSLWLRCLTLHAVAFSGVYRAVVVSLASFFLTKENADVFSSHYLVMMFGTSLIGFPAAAVLLERNVRPRAKQLFSIILISVFLFLIIYNFFNNLDSNVQNIIAISIALVSSCIFEVNRQILNNSRHYYLILIVSVMSFASCLFAVFFTDGIGAVLYFCVSMIVPAICSQVIVFFVKTECANYHNPLDLIKKFSSHSISGALSTSVNYLMPLILVGMLGSQYSSDFAVLSAILGISVFIPRFISNEFILAVQSGCQISHYFNDVFKKILISVLITIAILQLFMFFYIDSNYAVFTLFSCGVVLSQISLPYSNVFSVTGKSLFLLKTNIYSGIVLLIFTALLYSADLLTPLSLSWSFLFYQFCKFGISRHYYKTNSW